jgi:DNA-binding NarL/FixJ family response regulator
VIRAGIVHYLAGIEGFEIVFQAKNGKETIDKTRKFKPDVILTEIRMTRLRGDSALCYIRAKFPHVKMLVLTNDDSVESISSLILKGCNGYLLKSGTMNEVVCAINAVTDREFYYNRHVSRDLRNKIIQNRCMTKRMPQFRITKREKQVIMLVSRQRSAKQIAKELNISVRTVHRHYENIAHKSGAKNIVGIAMEAVKNEWV